MTKAEMGGVGVELDAALGRIEKLGALVRFCSSCEFNMQIPADPVAIGNVSAGVNELLAIRQWPPDEMMSVELAVQEALANAVRHGCKNDPGKQVQCCVTLNTAGELVIVVRDPGPGFDVTAVASPLDTGNLLKPSGRGVFLINQLMDSVEFTDEGRQVLMRKRRREPGAAARIYRS